MNAIVRKFSASAVVLAMVSGLAACENMSRQDKATAAGAAVGGVAGSVLTDGSALGTVGGAAVGGVVGREIGKDKK